MSVSLKPALAMAAMASLVGCHFHADRELLRQRIAAMQHPQPVLRSLTPDAERVAASVKTREQVVAGVDLDSYVRYGLHHNAGLRAAYEQFLAAVERIPQVSSLPDPVFSFTQFLEEVQTRTGPQQRRYSLTQAFPWFGELELRGNVARIQMEELWQRVVQKQLVVEQEIATLLAVSTALEYRAAAGVVVSDSSGQYAVVAVRELGAGRVILLGFDFFNREINL